MDLTPMFLHGYMVLFVLTASSNTLASVSHSEQSRQLESYQKENISKQLPEKPRRPGEEKGCGEMVLVLGELWRRYEGCLLCPLHDNQGFQSQRC